MLRVDGQDIFSDNVDEGLAELDTLWVTSLRITMNRQRLHTLWEKNAKITRHLSNGRRLFPDVQLTFDLCRKFLCRPVPMGLPHWAERLTWAW
jgi:hypothetical protein